ncbi:hypothetical protein D3C78_1124380 [compost metagenome]
MDRKSLIGRRLMLPMLALISACGTKQIESPAAPQVRPAAIPALPPQAQQLPVSPWCLPTCSSALMKERETWRQMLTKAGAED